MLRPRSLLLALSLLLIGTLCAAQASRKAPLTSDEERAALHAGEEWQIIQPHLPSPDTATAAELETAADVLRARRFPEDALDYYGYAIARGGNVGTLLNKMGIVRIELRQYDLAHQLFLRVVRANKKNAQAWNNLGATEFLNRHLSQAASYYRKAVSIEKRNAIFHANLGLVYFESSDTDSARKEFAKASALDPGIMQRHDTGGTYAHVLASADYPRLCYEFARMSAMNGNLPEMRQWLARAVEGGFDVTGALRDDNVLKPYQKDPEVMLIMSNAKQLRSHKVAANKPVPSLGPSNEH